MVARSPSAPLVRWALPAVVCVCCLLSFWPSADNRVVAWFRGPVDALTAPLSALSRRLTNTQRAPTADAQNTRAALDDALYWQTYWQGRALAAEAEIDRLTSQAALLSRLARQVDDSTVPVLAVNTAGNAAALTLRLDTLGSTPAGSVVTLDSMQLVGRLSPASGLTGRVVPITARGSRSIGGIVVTGTAPGQWVATSLKPDGAGALTGILAEDTDDSGRPKPPVAPGMLVRLKDEAWPQHAQFNAILGVVESVQPTDDAPPRQRITVRPGTSPQDQLDLTKASTVVVWIPREPAADPARPRDNGGHP